MKRDIVARKQGGSSLLSSLLVISSTKDSRNSEPTGGIVEKVGIAEVEICLTLGTVGAPSNVRISYRDLTSFHLIESKLVL